MPVSEEKMELVRAVKSRYERELMAKANVIGVGIGFRSQPDEPSEEPIIVVSVTRKMARSDLDPKDIVPGELDGVPVRVEALGELRPLGTGGP